MFFLGFMRKNKLQKLKLSEMAHGPGVLEINENSFINSEAFQRTFIFMIPNNNILFCVINGF